MVKLLLKDIQSVSREIRQFNFENQEVKLLQTKIQDQTDKVRSLLIMCKCMIEGQQKTFLEMELEYRLQVFCTCVVLRSVPLDGTTARKIINLSNLRHKIEKWLQETRTFKLAIQEYSREYLNYLEGQRNVLKLLSDSTLMISGNRATD